MKFISASNCHLIIEFMTSYNNYYIYYYEYKTLFH